LKSAIRNPQSAIRLLAPFGLLIGIVVASALLVSPFFETPFYDDWSFAPQALLLAKTGQLRYMGYNVPCLLSQVLLGAGWLRLVGPTFSNLRLLGLAVAAMGSCAAFGVFAELGLDRRRSLLGALALAANPLYVFFSYSWMTDVFSLAFMLLALWGYLVAFRRGGGWAVALAAAAALIAVLDRQTTAVLPVGVLAYLLWRRRDAPLALWLAAIAPLALGFVGLKLAELIPDYHRAGLPVPSLRKQYAAAPRAASIGLGYLAFSLLPLALAYWRVLSKCSWRRLGAGLGALVLLAALAAPVPDLAAGEWAPFDLEAFLLRAGFPCTECRSGLLLGNGADIVPRGVGLAVGAAAWVALAAMLVAAWEAAPRIRLEPRSARWRLGAAIAIGGLLVLLIAGMPLWRALAAKAVSLAHARGAGRGLGLDHWLTMARRATDLVAVILGVLLAFGLSEVAWQATARRGLRALWGFVELLVLSLLAGFIGGAVGAVALRGLWRWRRVEDEDEGRGRGRSAGERVRLALLPAGIYLFFLVVVMSRWDVFPRYLLPVVLPAALLVLIAGREAKPSWAAAGIAFAVFLAYALVRTDLYTSQLGATEQLRERLIAEGVPPKEIRAGVELDGFHWRWYCLDHPKEGGTTKGQVFWPGTLTPALIENYVITDENPRLIDLTGYEVLRRETFRARLWPFPRTLHVVRRVPLLEGK